MNGAPVIRAKENPIITPASMPIECSAVFNAGAVRFNGKYLLLLRVEDFRRQVDFHVATSDDGVHFDVNPKPINYPLRDIEKKYNALRFDMRITPLEGWYYVCHAVWMTGLGCTIGMGRTKDFVNFEAIYGSLLSPTPPNAGLNRR